MKYENYVIDSPNTIITPLGTVTIKCDTGNLKLQEEIEMFLKMLKAKYS